MHRKIGIKEFVLPLKILVCPNCGNVGEPLIIKKVTVAGWIIFFACCTASVVCISFADGMWIKTIVASYTFLFASLIGLMIKRKVIKCKKCGKEIG